MSKSLNIENFTKGLISAFLALALLSLNPQPVYAGSTIYLTPSSGSYSGDFSVNLDINTGGDTVEGVDLDVTYTGSVSFISGSAGNVGCSPSITESPSGTISVICLITPGQPFNGTGTIATLNFRPTSSGQVTLSIGNVDLGADTLDSTTGGTYTVSPGPDRFPTGTSSPGTTTTTSQLPTSGIFDNVYLMTALGLLLLVDALLIYKLRFGAGIVEGIMQEGYVQLNTTYSKTHSFTYRTRKQVSTFVKERIDKLIYPFTKRGMFEEDILEKIDK